MYTWGGGEPSVQRVETSKTTQKGGGGEKVNVGDMGSFELNRAPFYMNSCTCTVHIYRSV
jgi:hypothetical protein